MQHRRGKDGTFCLAAFVVRLQVEVRRALTDIGPRRVQAGVFADGVRHFTALVDVHTGDGTGVQSETCSTVAPLQNEKEKTGITDEMWQRQNLSSSFLESDTEGSVCTDRAIRSADTVGVAAGS